MSKTWWSIVTAMGLVAAAVVIFWARRAALGPESGGPVGWQVRVVVDGKLLTKDASISVVRPPDFRRQHLAEERFQNGPELRAPVKWKRFGQRKNSWRRQMDGAEPKPFHLEYSFLCFRQRPTPAMEHLTAKLDAPPRAAFLNSTPRIQAKDDRIVQAARQHAAAGGSSREKARALMEFVGSLGEQKSGEALTALECLQRGEGDGLGKARLLVALCRSCVIPSRLMVGLPLAGPSKQTLHYWAEAWDGAQWFPMDPIRHALGTESFPEDHLLFRMSDGPVVNARGASFNYTISVQPRLPDLDSTEVLSPSAAKDFWRKISFSSLHVSEQHVVEFLLLLPLAALIVSFVRTVIGMQTFGIFAPALIGLAFLDLQALPWGLPIFVLTVLVGWGLRHGLEHYHLLQVPRVAALLTLIVIFLLIIIVTASNLGITTIRFVSLFPLVILTFLVERFWTIEVEDSAAVSFQTLLGTIVVALLVSLALGPQSVRTWMLHYPETLGVVLAAQFLLGRYTGYRLTELYRFGDLIKDEPPGEKKP